MAEQNDEFIEREIKLNEMFIGERRLRYIYLYHGDVVSTELDENRGCTPLFLGCDVMFECNINCSNLPRFHAKHAKRGLATKINFPAGSKVFGINGTARGVWFYSIQGLFNIAFNYYSRNDQDGCLSKLQQVWRRQILDPILQKEVHVETIEKRKVSLVEISEEEISSKITDEVELVDKIKKNIDGYLLETKTESLQQELQLLKTYTSYINCEKNIDYFVNRAVIMLKSCLTLLPINSETSAHFSDNETILCEVAHWLGTEFANYQEHVNKSVTTFKQKHIRSIENLPSAEVLVSEVFPGSMQVLMQCWLQATSYPGSSPLPAGSAKNQNPTHENLEDGTLTLFPVIQLILELANQNLVSGVAHVLYSRLIQSESV